jgi:hypothetical protein
MAQYRMTFHRELRWLIASYLVGWALKLVIKEAGGETLHGFQILAQNFHNDPHFDTVKMRRSSNSSARKIS